MELICRILSHIVWIKSHLLDFTHAFSLIRWISHVSIVTSFITRSILTNCLLDYKIVVAKSLIQYHQGRKKGQYQCRDHLKGRTNLNRWINMEVIYHITKPCENDARSVQWRVKKIDNSSSV